MPVNDGLRLHPDSCAFAGTVSVSNKQILHQQNLKHYSDQLLQHLQNAITLFAKHLAFDVEGTKTVADSLKHFAGLFELD